MKGNLGSIETKAIHAGEPRPRIAGAVVMPVFQSATYQYAGEKSYDDVRYIRLNNTPNHLALAEKLAALENTEDAISNPLMQVPDLESVVSFAKSHGLVSMIDNTFASPVNFR